MLPAQVYGASAVPDQTSPHFTLATTGAAFSGTAGAEILFRTRACLRDDQSTCLPSSSPLYPYVSNGLDALVNQYFYTIRNVLGMTGNQPFLNSTEFNFMWNGERTRFCLPLEPAVADLIRFFRNGVESLC